ncbi:hypothetical protein FIM07_03650 [SAR202 cluster bacterium AD-802-F09_MRT_200m]|nr:hypothetical protein [SAR202 cluster bacterium AD-802-F09_MRT_200m]
MRYEDGIAGPPSGVSREVRWNLGIGLFLAKRSHLLSVVAKKVDMGNSNGRAHAVPPGPAAKGQQQEVMYRIDGAVYGFRQRPQR